MQLLQLIDLYSRVCEVYDTQLVWHCFRHTKNGCQPRFTDGELLTCYLFASGWENCRTIAQVHTCIRRHYLSWFPLLPSYQAFNHRLNGLADVLPLLLGHCLEHWADSPQTLASTLLLTDSFPVVTCAGNRRRAARVAPPLCDKGYCAMKKLYYYGVKVHLLAREQAATLPLPLSLTISPASCHDLIAQQDHWSQIVGHCLVADKAYDAARLAQQLREQNSVLITPHRRNPTLAPRLQQLDQAYEKQHSSIVGHLRQPIETLFSWLAHHTQLQQASRVRSFRGLLVHIYGKITAAVCRHKLAQVV